MAIYITSGSKNGNNLPPVELIIVVMETGVGVVNGPVGVIVIKVEFNVKTGPIVSVTSLMHCPATFQQSENSYNRLEY